MENLHKHTCQPRTQTKGLKSIRITGLRWQMVLERVGWGEGREVSFMLICYMQHDDWWWWWDHDPHQRFGIEARPLRKVLQWLVWLPISQTGGAGIQCRFNISGKMGVPILKSKLKPRNGQSQRVEVWGDCRLAQTRCQGPGTWLYGPTTNAKVLSRKSQCIYFPGKPTSVEKLDWVKLGVGPQHLQFGKWGRQAPWAEPVNLCPELSHCSLEPEHFHPPQCLWINGASSSSTLLKLLLCISLADS